MPRQGQYRDSTIFVYIPITSPIVDLTGNPCEVAFVPLGTTPVDGDYVAAVIITGNIVKILVGNYQNISGITYTGITDFPYKFDVYVDVTNGLERPREPVGTWTIF